MGGWVALAHFIKEEPETRRFSQQAKVTQPVCGGAVDESRSQVGAVVGSDRLDSEPLLPAWHQVEH